MRNIVLLGAWLIVGCGTAEAGRTDGSTGTGDVGEQESDGAEADRAGHLAGAAWAARGVDAHLLHTLQAHVDALLQTRGLVEAAVAPLQPAGFLLVPGLPAPYALIASDAPSLDQSCARPMVLHSICSPERCEQVECGSGESWMMSHWVEGPMAGGRPWTFESARVETRPRGTSGLDFTMMVVARDGDERDWTMRGTGTMTDGIDVIETFPHLFPEGVAELVYRWHAGTFVGGIMIGDEWVAEFDAHGRLRINECP